MVFNETGTAVRQDDPGRPSTPISLIPVGNFMFFHLLAEELGRIAAGEPDPALLVVTDHHTAAQVKSLEGACAGRGRVYVFGPPPLGWGADKAVTSLAAPDANTAYQQFLLVYAPSLSLALVGSWEGDGLREERGFSGGWTGDRSTVHRLIHDLLAAAAPEAAAGLPEASADATAHSLQGTERLMGLMARQLAVLQQNMVMDKNDLVSVLNILKAISAQRRAHDILYVFVEQIARLIRMRRCSVVRVWAGDAQGHVLASHDDESVSNLVIDLGRYPEVNHALRTREKVVINDVTHDPLTRAFATELKAAGLRAVMVIPILLFDENVGSLLLRAARGEGGFSVREISFCEILSEVAASALERAQLFENIQRANDRLEYLAVTDDLTGLYNYRHFRQRLEEEFDRAVRYQTPLSCLVCDIDDFKAVNDRFGHLQGDIVLREVAGRMKRTVRKSDTVARYGGEEFVVVMPQTDLTGAMTEGERLRRDLAEMRCTHQRGDLHITVSVGVATLDHAHMRTCDALVRVADDALYTAKRSGKNCVKAGPAGGKAE